MPRGGNLRSGRVFSMSLCEGGVSVRTRAAGMAMEVPLKSRMMMQES